MCLCALMCVCVCVCTFQHPQDVVCEPLTASDLLAAARSAEYYHGVNVLRARAWDMSQLTLDEQQYLQAAAEQYNALKERNPDMKHTSTLQRLMSLKEWKGEK